MLLFFCQMNIFYEDQRRGVKKGGERSASRKRPTKKSTGGGLVALILTGVLLLITPFFIVFGMNIDIWNISHSPLKTNSQGSNVTCDYLKWIRTVRLG